MNNTKIFLLVVLSLGNWCNFELPTHQFRTTHQVHYYGDESLNEEMNQLGALQFSIRTWHQPDIEKSIYGLEMAPCCRPLRLKEVDKKEISKPLPKNQTLPGLPTTSPIPRPSTAAVERLEPCLPRQEMTVPQEATSCRGDLVDVCQAANSHCLHQNTSIIIERRKNGRAHKMRPASVVPVQKPCDPRKPRVLSRNASKWHHGRQAYTRPGLLRKKTVVQAPPLSLNGNNTGIHPSMSRKVNPETNIPKSGIRQSPVELHKFQPQYWNVSSTPLPCLKQKGTVIIPPYSISASRNSSSSIPSFMELVVFPLHSLLWIALVIVNLVGQLLISQVLLRHYALLMDGNSKPQSVAMLEGKVYDSLPNDKLLSDSCVIVNLSPTNSEESLSDDWESPFDDADEGM